MHQKARSSTYLVVALVLLALSARAWSQPPPLVTVAVQPDQPLIEEGKHQQLLSIDFWIDNKTTEKIELSSVEVSVLGDADKLIAQYRVGASGSSVLVIPRRFIESGQRQLVFNPLYAFPDELDLKNLRFDFRFDVGDDEAKYAAQALVHPRRFTPKTQLSLPLRGPVLVYDGHDFYGHHRRLNLQDDMAQALKWKRNFMRYSYDFVVTDNQGHMFKNDGSRNQDWYGWGTPVLAPADGIVTRVVSNRPDNEKGKPPAMTRVEFLANPSLMWGNHVEIRHLDGETSLLAHMRAGSVKVAVGDAVKSGQQIGEIGFSGDAFLVHLHYDLKSGPGFDADGLPSPFINFERLTGANWLKVKHGQVDSGDIVRSSTTR